MLLSMERELSLQMLEDSEADSHMELQAQAVHFSELHLLRKVDLLSSLD